MPRNTDGEGPGLAMKIGITGVLAIGAVASGYFLSRPGRRMLREAFAGRRRTRLEDRVLEALWTDRTVGERTFDVEEGEGGVITLSGTVHSDDERRHALAVAGRAREVREIKDALAVEPGARRRRFHAVRDT